MRRFVEETDRGQWTLLPECLDDFIDENNPVRVIDVFVDALDLAEMSFEGVEPAATGRPSYHPSVLLKLRKVCARFVELCREMGLLAKASVAIDGSKFKAVNNRDRNFTRAKVERRRAQLEESVARYLSQLDTADLQQPSEALAGKTAHLKEKLARLKS